MKRILDWIIIKLYRIIFLMTFLSLFGKSSGQNISFFPKSDLIYLNDGCTGVILNYNVSFGDIDSIIISPGFNTYMDYTDSLGKTEFIEKSMFLVNKENDSNIYKLYLCVENDTTILIPPDSSFFVEYANYYLKLIVLNENIIIDSLSQQFHSDWGLGVEEESNIKLNGFVLKSNYPNPFNPSTTIKYEIPDQVRNDIFHVQLKVYDVLGREVATLVNKEQKAGNYEVIFDASHLTSGIYFYRLQSEGFVESRKMVLLH